tara:strand:+ start:59 stop:865 length:807 start_codon:yes stop_codon:yes gene_type:complete
MSNKYNIRPAKEEEALINYLKKNNVSARDLEKIISNNLLEENEDTPSDLAKIYKSDLDDYPSLAKEAIYITSKIHEIGKEFDVVSTEWYSSIEDSKESGDFSEPIKYSEIIHQLRMKAKYYISDFSNIENRINNMDLSVSKLNDELKIVREAYESSISKEELLDKNQMTLDVGYETEKKNNEQDINFTSDETIIQYLTSLKDEINFSSLSMRNIEVYTNFRPLTTHSLEELDNLPIEALPLYHLKSEIESANSGNKDIRNIDDLDMYA